MRIGSRKVRSVRPGSRALPKVMAVPSAAGFYVVEKLVAGGNEVMPGTENPLSQFKGLSGVENAATVSSSKEEIQLKSFHPVWVLATGFLFAFAVTAYGGKHGGNPVKQANRAAGFKSVDHHVAKVMKKSGGGSSAVKINGKVRNTLKHDAKVTNKQYRKAAKAKPAKTSKTVKNPAAKLKPSKVPINPKSGAADSGPINPLKKGSSEGQGTVEWQTKQAVKQITP